MGTPAGRRYDTSVLLYECEEPAWIFDQYMNKNTGQVLGRVSIPVPGIESR